MTPAKKTPAKKAVPAAKSAVARKANPKGSGPIVFARTKPRRILILGVNGFIGNSLVDRILKTTDWHVSGLDMGTDRIAEHLKNPHFRFLEGDITINKEWIEYHIKISDTVLPLVAIATPAKYVEDPLGVFQLDFLENLRIIEQAVRSKTRVIFPSTSEVYGMCPDGAFDEESSPLVYGPIHKERWIYSCSKQLLDRVIWAYGKHEGLPFTLFRPFNWIGPKLDSIEVAKEGSSRVLTQFIGNILRGDAIRLVDGGQQRRCFTDIEDGIDGLMAILANKNGRADGRIFNLGNPKNDYSIAELAEMVIRLMKELPRFQRLASRTKLIRVPSATYYGAGYQDVTNRVPKIENARRSLGWRPKVGMEDSLRRTLKYYHDQMESPT